MITRLLTLVLFICPLLSYGQTTPVSTVYRPLDNSKDAESRTFAKYGNNYILANIYANSNGEYQYG